MSHYCSSSPHLTTGVRKENRFFGCGRSLEFFTRSLPCLTELYSLFYPNKVKIIPQNIYELLTPVALAHLIMGDGSPMSHGLSLCTDSYSLSDTVRIINVLIIRYGLKCTLHLKRENKYRIYISRHSMAILRTIVGPHMHSSMLYKLGVINSN